MGGNGLSMGLRKGGGGHGGEWAENGAEKGGGDGDGHGGEWAE